MILQPFAGTLISNELLRGLDSALTQRQIEKGLTLLHEHADVLARAHPKCDNAARLADHLARWIDMDFSLLAPVEKLIQRFSRSARARLPLGDSLRIRLARGITRMHRGQFDDATADFSLVIAAKEEIADRSMLMIAHYCLGRCYRNKGMYETAAAYTRDAARLASGSRLAKQRTVIRVLESWILFQQGDIDEASRGLKQVERQLSATDDYVSQGNVFCFRARLTRRSGNHDEALKLWESGVEMFRRRKSSIGHPNLARALSDMAHTRLLQARTLQREADRLRSLAADDEEEAERMKYARRDSLKSAGACREKALTEIEAAEKIYARFRNHHGLGTCLLRHAMLHLSAGDVDNALKCAAKAYELGRKADYLLMGGARIVQCMIEGEMCESLVPEFREHGRLAHFYAQQAVLYAEKTQHLELQARAHLAMGFALLNPPLRKTEAATQSHQKATALINAASLKHLSKELEELWKPIAQATPATGPMNEWLVRCHGKTLDEIKRYIFQAVWQKEKGHARGVARNLGISRGAAKASLRRYGLPTTEVPMKPVTKKTKNDKTRKTSNRMPTRKHIRSKRH